MSLSNNQSANSAKFQGSFEDQDDFELVAQIGNGDKAAMTAFVTRYINRITDFAMRHLGRRPDAEDVAQEAFIRVWQNAQKWESRDIPPRNWLYKITYNLCIDEIRKRKKIVSDLENSELVASEQPDIDLQQMEKMKKVEEAIQELPERQRTALVLFSYQGFSNRDTAEIMDISVEALESLLARGRRKLRDQLMDTEESTV